MYRNRSRPYFLFTLWACLIALTIIVRYPVTPHEIGWDTFAMHSLVNSISEFGQANWWVNLLSIGGFYPCSYASSVPFIVSGISQCTGIDVEWAIWLFCTITGIFTIFFAYIMAGAIMDDDIFKFFVAFGFSTAPGLLGLTTWGLSTRALLIVLLPLFIYLLLKIRDSLKYIPLAIVLFVVLLVTHHLFFFIIPVVLIYIAISIFYKLKGYIKVKIPEFAISASLLSLFVIMLLIPFFTRIFISETATRYIWYELVLMTYVRVVGVLFIFAISGFIYLLSKNNKVFEEWFFLVFLICFTPFLFIIRYTNSFALIFLIVLAGIGLGNLAKVYTTHKRKYALSIIIIGLLLSVSFSGFYQYYHTNIVDRPTYYERYMEESTYIGAIWIKNNVNKDKVMVDNDAINLLLGRRIFAISEVLTLTGDSFTDLTYGLTNITEVNISKNSPLTKEFYMDNPYIKTPMTPDTGFYRSMLNGAEFDSIWGKYIISKFNLSFLIENEDIGDNVFTRSVHKEKNKVYANGKINLWLLD